LLIGIGVGTFSSVFIAAPVVLDLEKDTSADKKLVAKAA
jgi:preprotein translocase subunit SecF